MFTRLRGEIAAVVSLGAAALVATGYGITDARLHNVEVPAGAALSALPASYFLGEALQATVLPLILLLSVGAIWIALYWARRSGQEEPRVLGGRIPLLLSWSVLAFLLMVSAWLIDVLTHHGELDRASQGYWPVTIVLLIVVPALVGILAPYVVGAGSPFDEAPVTSPADANDTRQQKQAGDEGKDVERASAPTRRGRLTSAVLLTALISIIGASTIRIANAGFLEDALPAVLVSAKPENCTLLGPTINRGHCYFKGYYLGENGQWLFLIWKPATRQTIEVAREAAKQLLHRNPRADNPEIEEAEEEALEKFRNRLVLVPRDDVLQILEADKPSELPED